MKTLVNASGAIASCLMVVHRSIIHRTPGLGVRPSLVLPAAPKMASTSPICQQNHAASNEASTSAPAAHSETESELLQDWTQYLLFAIKFLTEGFVYEYPQEPLSTSTRVKPPSAHPRRVGACQMTQRVPKVTAS